MCPGPHVLARIAAAEHVRHPGVVSAIASQRRTVNWRMPNALAAAAAAVFAGATVLEGLSTFGAAQAQSPGGMVLTTVALLPSVVIGCLVTWRVPDSFVGPAVSWVGAAPALVAAVESWGDTLLGPHPWPAAPAMFDLKQGIWVWNFAGFVALCLVFPDGPLTGRFWRRLPLLAVVAGCLLNAAVSLDPTIRRVDGVTRGGYSVHLPAAVRGAELVLAFAAFLSVLAATAASLVVRYRRPGEVARSQLRWLMLSAGAVPVALALGWLAELAGAPTSFSYAPFMIVILIAVPIAVAVAILRHDLYDVDRLLGSSLAWLLTSLVSAAIFAATVYAIGEAVSAASRVGVTAAAFLTALLLLPLYRGIHEWVGRVVDRERTLILARVDEFVLRVRDGDVEPEQVVTLLRSALRDRELQLLLRLPGARDDEYVDIDGHDALPHGPQRIALVSNDVELGLIVLGSSSSRRLWQARAAVSRARLPIEVVRLRIELRRALEEVKGSRARLLAATTSERRRLERDLHDGAQRQIVAVGMRLRSLQARLGRDAPEYDELDAAVAALEETVAELRRLAHTNALKHAAATRLSASIAADNGRIVVEIHDDGIGGAKLGFGLTSLRDRVSAAGGSLTVRSPAGGGTSIVAELACAS